MTHRLVSAPLRATACALALAAIPVLSGCSGVVKNLNSAQVNVPNVTVSNPFGLNGQTAQVALTGASASAVAARAALKGHDAPGTSTFYFANQAISLAQIKDAQLSATVAPTATLDTSGPLPATFTVQSITVNATVSDANADGTAAAGGVALPTVQSGGPITFTLGSDGKTYSAGASDISLTQSASLTSDQANALLAIVTSGPTNAGTTGGASKDNVVVVTSAAAVTSASSSLSGRTLTITFDNSSLKVVSQ